MLASTKESIAALRDIVGLVKAKVLVVIIDDANDITLLKSVVSFIDSLGSLDRTRDNGKPGVLVILSMLEATYDRIMNSTEPR
jgi:hypothetical protein